MSVKLYYGVSDSFFDKPVNGGFVKFYWLNKYFPNTVSNYDILYIGSSSLPPGAFDVVKEAKEKGAKFVWNQNGVGHNGWAPDWALSDIESVNAPIREFIHSADYVVYQSEFAKSSSDKYLGSINAPNKVLYNPVDVNFFKPFEGKKFMCDGKLRLLLAGSQYHKDKFVTGVNVLKVLSDSGINAELIVAGRVSWPCRNITEPLMEAEKIIGRMGLAGRVKFLGVYGQEDAPRIYNSADILIHPKYNDVCPTAVIEAMACGLPVVCMNNGGTVELVGEMAGIAVGEYDEKSCEKYLIPNYNDMADAVIEIKRDIDTFSKNARERSLKFDLKNWVKEHRKIFSDLLK